MTATTIEMNGHADPANQTQELVGIEVVPVGKTSDRCEGAVIKLVRGEGTEAEVSLAAGLGPEQCREIARRLLTIADAVSRGAECTVMCVSATSMWKLPGQALIVRQGQNGVVFEFAIDPQKMDKIHRLPKRKLILPVGR